uniref:Uncharacterized protein n=1 Tax=Megaviridae environmental sample TaxID=1737588 RepID=A0A5J6VJD4_9VIRU|nr:MAG: hypothetical protein [Megaviridae environmental sample]
MLYFIAGFLSGAYVAQKYSLPNIENIIFECVENLKDYEKKDNKKK